MKALAVTVLMFVSAQTAWADCDELRRQGESTTAAATEAGNRYRPIAAEHLADRLQIKGLQPSVKAVAEVIPETERMIAAMNKELDYLVSMKDGGCWGVGQDAEQSMVVTLFRGQRDELVAGLKRLTEYVKQHE